METKQCTKCKRILPMDTNHFKKSKRGKDGFNPQCKECTGGHFIPYIKEGYMICTMCKRELPLDEYHFMRQGNTKTGFRHQCKECIGYKFTNPKPIVKEGYKICSKCGRELKATTDYFFKQSNSELLMGYCKECGGYSFTKHLEVKKGYKICSKCKRELPANTGYFYNWENGKDKLYPSCRECNGSEFDIFDGYKTCSKCNKRYPANKKYFSVNKECKYGLSPVCRKCQREYLRKYTEQNRETISTKRKIYYADNKEKIQFSRKMFRELNKEHFINLNKKYKNNRRSREKNVINDLTLEDWKESLEFFNNKDAYTGLPMKVVSQDHIIPLSKGGGYTKYNIIPCEKDVNAAKRDEDMEIWYKKQSYFSQERLNKIYQWIDKKTQHSE